MHIWPAGSYRGAVPRAVPLAMARAGTGSLPPPPPDLRATAALLDNRGSRAVCGKRARRCQAPAPFSVGSTENAIDAPRELPQTDGRAAFAVQTRKGEARRVALPGAKVAKEAPAALGGA